MPSVNSCTFIGVCGADPTVRSFDNGRVANVNIACTERWKDRNGEQKENTEWIPVVFNDKLAEIAEKYITKGMHIYVCGKFRTRSWTDHDGNKRYQSEIVVRDLQILTKKEDGTKPQAATPTPRAQAPVSRPEPQDNAEDDLPFSC